MNSPPADRKHPTDLNPDAVLPPSPTDAQDAKPEPRLLDRMRSAIRLRHYSIRTEDTYVHWVRRFIVFHGKRHPLELGASEVASFLTHLAMERGVGAST